MSSAPQRADAAFVNQLSVLLVLFVKDYQKDNSPIMLGSIACVKRCSSWYFLSPSGRFNVLQIDFSIDNLDEHKRGEVLRAHHYCSSNAISALALNSTIRYANFTHWKFSSSSGLGPHPFPNYMIPIVLLLKEPKGQKTSLKA